MQIRNFKPGPGFAIFVIFFGVATLEAFQTSNWLMVLFWLGMAVVFLMMDGREKRES